jgi:FtsZ-binding cell division protein ZapB
MAGEGNGQLEAQMSAFRPKLFVLATSALAGYGVVAGVLKALSYARLRNNLLLSSPLAPGLLFVSAWVVVYGYFYNMLGDIQEQYTALQNQNTALQNQNADLQNQNTALQNQNADLQNQNTALQNQNADLQNQNTDLQNQNTALQNQNTALQNQHQNLLNATRQTLNKLEEEKRKLKIELETLGGCNSLSEREKALVKLSSDTERRLGSIELQMNFLSKHMISTHLYIERLAMLLLKKEGEKLQAATSDSNLPALPEAVSNFFVSLIEFDAISAFGEIVTSYTALQIHFDTLKSKNQNQVSNSGGKMSDSTKDFVRIADENEIFIRFIGEQLGLDMHGVRDSVKEALEASASPPAASSPAASSPARG